MIILFRFSVIFLCYTRVLSASFLRIKYTYVSRITFMSKAYIMAGNAISPLLNMNGDEAIAIACAAFCIPTSITIVRCMVLSKCPTRDRSELHKIANRISRVADAPNTMKLAVISVLYCKKKTMANNISAGNATFPRTLLTMDAALGR